MSRDAVPRGALRALVLAALADGPGAITRPLHARDTLLMARALTALGARIDTDATPGTWRVAPGRPAGDARVDVGNAGTVMRFVPAVAALSAATVEFHGDARASQRPVAPILAALRELGAVIDDGGRGAIPFAVRGTGSLAGGAVTLDASASSQFVSGLLLAAPRFDKGVEVRHRGHRVPSAPHIAMTVQMLRAAGAEVETASMHNDPAGPHAVDTWRVHPGPVRAGTLAVEPDVVNATPFLAAALVTGGTVTISGWPPQTTQPGEEVQRVAGARPPTAGWPSPAPAPSTASPPILVTCPSSRRCWPRWPRWPIRRRGSPASGTSGSRRPTGFPRWPPRSTGSAGMWPSFPTAWRSGPARCTAGCSPATTTTGW